MKQNRTCYRHKGKVKENADVLSDLALEVIAQTDLGIESPEETGLTFVENALLGAVDSVCSQSV